LYAADDATAAARRDGVVRDARDQTEALGDAVSQIGDKIAAAETNLAELRDRAEREELSANVRADADRLHDTALELAAAGGKAIAALDAVAARVPLAPDFLPRVRMLLQDLPEAIDQAVGTAAEYSAQIMSGAAVHRVAPPEPEPVPASQIERMQIYTLQNLMWHEGAQTFTRPRYAWANPPRHLAIAACERDLADVPGSTRTEKLTQAFGINGGPGPMPDQCIAIDALDLPATELPAEGQPRSVPRFETHVGEPYIAELA
jgi:hypothetical protein